MKKMLIVGWCIFLFTATCTDSPVKFVFHQSVQFKFSTPKFSDFFNFHDIRITEPYWFLFKGGHFVGFFILDLLYFYVTNDRNKATLFSFSFALATEILQLFFSRDGRLYDVMIDAAGAWLAYITPVDYYHYD